MPLILLAAYLLGSIPFALLLARRWGVHNLRLVGSGNLGAANVVRASGMRAGVLVALLDMSKGAASVLLAERLSQGGVSAPAAAGFMAIVGHIYPVWLGFRGGKGVATACGVFSVLTPAATGISLGLFTLGVGITRYISVGSLLACAALPPIAFLSGSPASVVSSAAGSACLIVFRHRSNVARIWRGVEPRIVSFGGRHDGRRKERPRR